MADEPTTPPAGDPPPPAPTPAAEPPPPADLGDAGKKALADERKARREAEARLKELEPLAARAKEHEDAQKTEVEKLIGKLQTSEADGASSKASLLRLEVALDNAPAGIEPAKLRSLAERLRGSTREELEADAAELFADFAPTASTTPGNGQRTPVEQLRPGALPTPPEQTLADQVAAAEKAGDWKTAQRLKSMQLLELQKKTT